MRFDADAIATSPPAGHRFTQEVDLSGSFVLALSHDGSVRRRCVKVWDFATVVGVKFEA